MIGIFDSGIGGLTVAREVRRQLPDYQLVYFGDTARTPYGNKSNETVIEYAIQDTQFLLDRGAQLIIIACNTASAVAADALKGQFPDVPIFEVVTPAVTAAQRQTKNKQVGVIGTRTTINTDIYRTKLLATDDALKVTSKACPLFVPLAEEGLINDQITKMMAKRYLGPLKRHQIDTLILGCTHYPILRDVIQQKIGRRVTLVDPATPTVTAVRTYLQAHPDLDRSLERNSNHQYYFSDIPAHLQQLTTRWLGETIKPRQHHMQS